jgi:pimeloyl-ACP methyl ester carboxylesterase
VSGNALGPESGFRRYRGPSLLIAGDQDHVSSPQAIRAAVSETGGEAEVVITPGVDHFWWGHEGELTDIIQSFLQRLG